MSHRPTQARLCAANWRRVQHFCSQGCALLLLFIIYCNIQNNIWFILLFRHQNLISAADMKFLRRKFEKLIFISLNLNIYNGLTYLRPQMTPLRAWRMKILEDRQRIGTHFLKNFPHVNIWYFILFLFDFFLLFSQWNIFFLSHFHILLYKWTYNLTIFLWS